MQKNKGKYLKSLYITTEMIMCIVNVTHVDLNRKMRENNAFTYCLYVKYDTNRNYWWIHLFVPP